MASAYDVVSVVLGILGIISIPQLIFQWLLWSFPTRKLKDLDDVMAETTGLFQQVMGQGLLTNPDFISDTEGHLLSIRTTAEEMRTKVHCATNFWKQLSAWRSGLSRRITDLHREVELLRAEISLVSDTERERLENEGRFVRPSILSPTEPEPYVGFARVNRRLSGRTGYRNTRTSSFDAPLIPHLTHRVSRPPPALLHSNEQSNRGSTSNLVDSSSSALDVAPLNAERSSDHLIAPQVGEASTQPRGGEVLNVGTLFHTLVDLSDTITDIASTMNVSVPDFSALRRGQAGIREGYVQIVEDEHEVQLPNAPSTSTNTTEAGDTQSGSPSTSGVSRTASPIGTSRETQTLSTIANTRVEAREQAMPAL